MSETLTPVQRREKLVSAGIRFGTHYAPGGKYLIQSLAQAQDEAATAIQLFPGNPHRYWSSHTSDEDCETWLAGTRDTYVIVHSVYITNLGCNPDGPDKRGYNMTQKSLINQLVWAERHGASALVFHPGSPKGAGIENSIDWAEAALRNVLSEYQGPVNLALENAAHPDKLGGRVSDLLELCSRIKDDRLKVVIDTTHAFAAGSEIWQIKDDLQETILRGRLECVHFNTPDPPVECGSKLDRHSVALDEGKFTFDEIIELYKIVREHPIIMEGSPYFPDDLKWLLKFELEYRATGQITVPEFVAPTLANSLGDIFDL